MKAFATIICALLLPLAASAITPEECGGIYRAYPVAQTVAIDLPDGYKPFYISHYGRHGSRWITDDHRYTDLVDALDANGPLTPFGQDVRRRLDIVLDDAIGRSGSITPLGERQHHDIAARMIAAYPEVFADSAVVRAVSSTSLRCAMSMSYFTEALKEANQRLRVHRSAYHGAMDYIAHTSPEGKAFSDEHNAPWVQQYRDFCSEILDLDRIVASLFVNPDAIDPRTAYAVVDGLYWIAVDMQNTDLDLTFFDVFTPAELEAFWRTINSRMYICNADYPPASGVMLHCADNLLRDILTRASSATNCEPSLTTNCELRTTNIPGCEGATVLGGFPPSPESPVAADLRFGHDTHLLRLLALMGIEGATAQTSDLHRISDLWREYDLSPMAANLQLIFYRPASLTTNCEPSLTTNCELRTTNTPESEGATVSGGFPPSDSPILVRVLLNERDARLPLAYATPAAPLYDWAELRAYLASRLAP